MYRYSTLASRCDTSVEFHVLPAHHFSTLSFQIIKSDQIRIFLTFEAGWVGVEKRSHPWADANPTMAGYNPWHNMTKKGLFHLANENLQSTTHSLSFKARQASALISCLSSAHCVGLFCEGRNKVENRCSEEPIQHHRHIIKNHKGEIPPLPLRKQLQAAWYASRRIWNCLTNCCYQHTCCCSILWSYWICWKKWYQMMMFDLLGVMSGAASINPSFLFDAFACAVAILTGGRTIMPFAPVIRWKSSRQNSNSDHDAVSAAGSGFGRSRRRSKGTNHNHECPVRGLKKTQSSGRLHSARTQEGKGGKVFATTH